MLKLVDITKEYRTEDESVFALRGVSVEFRKSEFVSILGPSGCGKTTLLNIVGGLDRYTSGDIRVDGVSTTEYRDEDWDTYRNRRIGFVFQSYNLIPHMNVLKNVQLSLTLAGISKEEGRERALEALRKVGLEKQAKKRPGQMSGGQMQRVAIARALVNDPDIILADEPTGALDSESGVQVMELLKEVARDRLVVMVTHNGQLAEEYSTRIINLKDGEIVGDTMPYDSEAEEEAAPAAPLLRAEEESAGTPPEGAGETPANEAVRDEAQEGKAAENGVESAKTTDKQPVLKETSESAPAEAPAKKRNVFQRIGDRIRAIRKREKSYMSIATAVNLSWTNLLSKKGRTLLTSIAGSIGIIGIVVVLALSNGVGAYIAGLEENALSQYPITINEQDMSLSALMEKVMGATNTNPEYPDTGEIVVGNMLGNLINNKDAIFGTNDLKSIRNYIETNKSQLDGVGVVKYQYGIDMNIFADAGDGGDEYMKIYPFTDLMGDVLDDFQNAIDIVLAPGATEQIKQFAASTAQTWDEMSPDTHLLEQQYELVGENSRWPQNDREVVIVVDEYNQIPDFTLFMLGLRSTSELLGILTGGGSLYEPIDIDTQVIGKEYYILTNADYYYQTDSGVDYYPQNMLDKETIDSSDPIKVTVSGVIRPRRGVSVTSINGVVGYRSGLMDLLMDKAESSDIVEAQLDAFNAANPDVTAEDLEKDPSLFKPYNSVAGFNEDDDHKDPNFSLSYTYLDGKRTVSETVTTLARGTLIKSYDMHIEVMRALGIADKSTPQSIKIYPTSFDNKAVIEEFLSGYGKETGDNIKYTDQLAIIMSFVEQMSSTVTQVLVGFAAISLIVSTIMIAIIIYTSVLERRKEIGVLRSLGARKKDISRVFIAESAILGAYSGAIGVIVAVAVSFAGSALLAAVLGITGLMQVSWWQCVAMFCVSILLSVLAGFIPSRIASKKDPTVALRSE